MSRFLERHQVFFYLVALACGALIGSLAPSLAARAQAAINPVLGLLLYATFLSVPVASISAAWKDLKFLAAVSAVNFVVAPVVVWLVAMPVAHRPELYAGVLFVLLCPCIDYVITFTGLAGGARQKLLAAAPLLLFGQMLLLPLYLRLFLGSSACELIDPEPFLNALVWLIALPLTAAVLTQVLGVRWLMNAAEAAMVPLMMATLFVVVASQVTAVGGALTHIAPVVPIFALFALVMAPTGAVVARLVRLETPSVRAVAMSGATRNSLVILPLVFALPAGFELAPLVVVTQTLVELVIMVAFVRVLPALIR